MKLKVFMPVFVLLSLGIKLTAQEDPAETNQPKNAVRFDFSQRSSGIGLTYDRLLHSNNVD